MKASPGRTRPGRQAYPPHVVGTAASGMNNVFEGLDSSAWAAFIQNLEDLIEVCILMPKYYNLSGLQDTHRPQRFMLLCNYLQCLQMTDWVSLVGKQLQLCRKPSKQRPGCRMSQEVIWRPVWECPALDSRQIP